MFQVILEQNNLIWEHLAYLSVWGDISRQNRDPGRAAFE
jgi:hypothetical protein